MNVVEKKIVMHWFLGIVCCLFHQLHAADAQWTWLLKTVFNDAQRALHSKKKEFVVATALKPSSQIIVSWNAERPHQGYLSLYAQARDASTKKWHAWHKMYDWGADLQRSHLTKSEHGSSYYYVRLEVSEQHPVDALRIRVEANDGADLGLVHALYASTSNMSAFVAEQASDFFSLPSVFVKGVPRYSQKVLNHPKRDVLCSPTSVSMVLGYVTRKKIDPVLIAGGVHDTGLGAFGSWPFNMAHAFECLGHAYACYVRRLPSFATVYQYLSHKTPVVVSVRGVLPGAAKDYPHGHLLVIVGWDAVTKKVICHDPAFGSNKEVLAAYPLKDFLVAWERSRRLAYCIEAV